MASRRSSSPHHRSAIRHYSTLVRRRREMRSHRQGDCECCGRRRAPPESVPQESGEVEARSGGRASRPREAVDTVLMARRLLAPDRPQQPRHCDDVAYRDGYLVGHENRMPDQRLPSPIDQAVRCYRDVPSSDAIGSERRAALAPPQVGSARRMSQVIPRAVSNAAARRPSLRGFSTKNDPSMSPAGIQYQSPRESHSHLMASRAA